jgi:ATP-dependent DNA helicase RecG
LDMIGKHQPVSREEINELLLDKLAEVLNEDQKMDKIHNLVSSLSGQRIRNTGSRRTPRWVLIDDEKQ